mgnify:CR=1 FL=1
MLKDTVALLRTFKGFSRKSVLKELVEVLGDSSFDDAGMFELEGWKIVVTAEGIVEDIILEDPWSAGYYSVMTNVNDALVKGARPVGYWNVLSSNSPGIRRKIAEGIKFGLDKYAIKPLKGHTEPDTPHHSIVAGIVGIAKNFIPSTTANEKNDIIVAIDLDGKFERKGWVHTFDSIHHKTTQQIQQRMDGIIGVANQKLAEASRDISGPGIVGSLAMMCESSGKGAEVDLAKLPKPAMLDLDSWLTTYPSSGFIFATSKPEPCLEILRSNGFTTEKVGKITPIPKILVKYGNEQETFIDFRKESCFAQLGG